MHRALILTAKDTETKAVKAQLHGIIRSMHTPTGNQFLVYSLRSSDAPNAPHEGLEVALYEAGRGQSDALFWTQNLVPTFEPDVVLFVGCAGGELNHIAIGDVLVPTMVWPYEKASQGRRTTKSKANFLEPARQLLDHARVVAELGRWNLRLPPEKQRAIPVHFAPIASGAKVIKHTETPIWKYIKNKVSDEIIACETEAHGFLAGLQLFRTYGLMIRGISDNLIDKDSLGKTVDDKSQISATENAAAFAASLLTQINYNVLRQNRIGTSRGETSRAFTSDKSIFVENLHIHNSTVLPGATKSPHGQEGDPPRRPQRKDQIIDDLRQRIERLKRTSKAADIMRITLDIGDILDDGNVQPLRALLSKLFAARDNRRNASSAPEIAQVISTMELLLTLPE